MRLTLFIIRQAISEICGAKQRALLMVACIAIGIAAISAIQVYTSSILTYYGSNIRALNGGDITMDSHPDIDKAQRNFLSDGAETGRFTFTEVRSSQDYLYLKRDASKSMMIQLTSVTDPASYPLYGKLQTEGSSTPLNGRDILAGGEILLSLSTMLNLGAHTGDIVLLGEKEYRIGGVLTSDSAMDSLDIGFIGKVIVKAVPVFEETPTLEGSKFYIKVRSPEEIDKLVSELNELIKPVTSPNGRKPQLVRTYRDTQKEIAEEGDNLSNLLMVAGLASLLLGGLGIYTTANIMISQRMRDIAIIKCVGGKTSQILAIFGIQVLLLSISGILLGLAAGSALSAFIPSVIESLMPIRPEVSISWPVILKVGFLGILVSLLFSALPLMNIGKIRPLLLYRDEMPKDLYKRSWLASLGLLFAATAIFGLGIAAVVGMIKVGLGVAFGILTFIGTLYWPVRATVKLFCRLPAGRSIPARLGLRSLERQGSRVVSSVLAIAVGVGAIVLVTLVQDNIIRTINGTLETAKTYNVMVGGAPRNVMADARKMISRSPFVAKHSSIVLLNGRFSEKNGKPLKAIKQNPGDASLPNASLTGIDPTDKIMKKPLTTGRWLSLKTEETAELVIDTFLAGKLGIKVGDTLQFDHMTVEKTRHILFKVVGIYDDRNSGNFIRFDFGSSILVDTSALAEHGLSNTGNEMLLIKTKPGIKGGVITSGIQKAFPSIRIVMDVGQFLDMFIGIIETATRFVQFLGLFSMASGGIILAGIIILTKYRRRKDIAIIRCIGGRTKTVL